jgi:hypothetical protein
LIARPVKFVLAALLLTCGIAAGQSTGELKVQISWGRQAPKSSPYYHRFIPSENVEVRSSTGLNLEAGEGLKNGAWQGSAGATDVDFVNVTLAYPRRDIQPIQDMQVIWSYLLAHSDADTVRRLTQDPAFRPDPRTLTVQMGRSGTKGFTLTVDQLLNHKAIWVRDLDTYITTGNSPVPFADHLRDLKQEGGRRILDKVHEEPEATYEQYEELWEDMGNPAYSHPAQEGPGHIVGLTWDSAIPKFGIDRAGGVWNDYGNPDHFRFWFGFSDLAEGVVPYWKGQHLTDGFPVVTTTIERDQVRYDVEQFAYPLNGTPAQRTGDLEMVLLQKVKLANLTNQTRTIPVTMVHTRAVKANTDNGIITETEAGKTLFEENGHRDTLLVVEPAGFKTVWNGVHQIDKNAVPSKRVDSTVFVELPANGTREIIVKLPSPVVPYAQRKQLAALDYASAKQKTLAFWKEYVERGARFDVPDPAVNELFRASLWHALRLPRRHTAADGTVKIDLPYSNFAYDQTGTPWPVNQAVYVDYMLYGLRGYNEISSEEIEAIYRNNQEFSGHVGGWASWTAYTPGMLYAVGQNYLLSGDRKSFERVLPATLKALEWCMGQVREGNDRQGIGHGLVLGPLNDLTGEGYWAFNQAYMYAGLEVFGKALAQAGYSKAHDVLDAAGKFRVAVQNGFQTASIHSPLVELRDHTWIPYVPSDAERRGRLFALWYPTDVDTGATHLIRLKVLPATSDLATWLLNDHEDNLFLHGWGIANEPVYNQQATAYLQRDDPKAAIRAFYSYMASGFSHSTFEPVEHRWRWGQFFGPPSTDGAWFELYRNMLVREADDDTLLLGQAAPRRWLEDGKRIQVQKAPTWFGDASYEIDSHTNSGTISATVHLEARRTPANLIIRLRHPEEKKIHSVKINGNAWKDFDSTQEWVRIPHPENKTYSIEATYR